MLGVPTWGAIGILESLWHFAQRFAPRGDIGKFTDDDIAADLEWKDDCTKLIDTLVECGWLDRCETHRLLIHDWADHCDRTVKKYLTDNNLDFAKLSVRTSAHSVRTDGYSELHPPSQAKPSQIQAKPNPVHASADDEITKHVQTCIAITMRRKDGLLLEHRGENRRVAEAIEEWRRQYPIPIIHGKPERIEELIRRAAEGVKAADLAGTVQAAIGWMNTAIDCSVRGEVWPGEYRESSAAPLKPAPVVAKPHIFVPKELRK